MFVIKREEKKSECKFFRIGWENKQSLKNIMRGKALKMFF